jgi:hypothetical protein
MSLDAGIPQAYNQETKPPQGENDMNWIKLDGTICGTIKSATEFTDNYGKPRLRLDGVWEGTPNNILECPTHVGNQLAEVGVMGQDSAGQWVDSSKRVAIWKVKDNGQTIWGASLGEGLQTQMASQPARQQGARTQQRPMTPRPQGASSAPQQRPPQSQPSNGQAQRPAASLTESPEQVRRRIEATFTHCLDQAAKSWGAANISGPIDHQALQASAATLFIAMNNAGVLLADPQAPPPITADQKSALAGFRATWHRLSMVVNGQTIVGPALDDLFNSEVAKFGALSSLTADQANLAIDHMAKRISAREEEIKNLQSADPSPPAFSGKESDIPF